MLEHGTNQYSKVGVQICTPTFDEAARRVFPRRLRFHQIGRVLAESDSCPFPLKLPPRFVEPVSGEAAKRVVGASATLSRVDIVNSTFPSISDFTMLRQRLGLRRSNRFRNRPVLRAFDRVESFRVVTL